MKPVKVKIVSANDILTAGIKTPLRCEAWGSSPPGLFSKLINEYNKTQKKEDFLSTVFFIYFKKI